MKTLEVKAIEFHRMRLNILDGTKACVGPMIYRCGRGCCVTQNVKINLKG